METIARHFYGFWQKSRKMKCVVQLPERSCIACDRGMREHEGSLTPAQTLFQPHDNREPSNSFIRLANYNNYGA